MERSCRQKKNLDIFKFWFIIIFNSIINFDLFSSLSPGEQQSCRGINGNGSKNRKWKQMAVFKKGKL